MKYKIGVSMIIFIILLVLFIPNTVLGANNGYTIESYNINMVVNEDNTFDITETISVNFTSSKHGIYRKIPLKNTVEREDGTKSSNIAKISNIQVNETYTTFNEDGYKVIKIGSTDKNVTGKQTYIIKYTYNIGKDPLKDADELYFNLIGDEWDTIIKNVNFTIRMPKSFDETKLGFSTTYYYANKTFNVIYDVNENIITGSIDANLYPMQPLTIRLALPEGYFVGASSNFDYNMLLQISISIIFVIIAYKLWKKYGRDNISIETVEFYPPNDLNSVDIAFLYKGHSEQKDIISLLIYLANKGYLRIEEYEEETLKIIKSKNFKIVKIKEYDGNNKEEQIFFNDLFKLKNEVTKRDLYNKFYLTLKKISKNINRKENQEKVFEKASLGKRIFIIGMIIVVFLFMGGLSVIKLGDPGIIIMILSLLGTTLSFLYNKPNKITIILASIAFVVISFFCMFIEILTDKIYLIKFIIESICIVFLIVFLGIIKKRTQYGNEMLGKIQGFKNFLEIAQKPQLEKLVMKDPEYFYNILPYTYVLGVSNRWMEKFEDIAIQPATWHSSNSHYNSTYNTRSFNSFMNSTYSSISNAMSSSPSGSGSGGGIAGGGSGGGGGGSW